MALSRLVRLLIFSLLCQFSLCYRLQAGDIPHELAVGATYVGAQIHWGVNKRWALEARALKDTQENNHTIGTITAYAYSIRGYHYLRPPQRTRIYWGVEAASTRSDSQSGTYKTTGFAVGGFGGVERYLLKRFSFGLDIGPYLISSKVKGSDTASGEMSVVVNTYVNFYLL